MREINVSVRSLVEFILRSGSIDTGYMSQNRMQDGVRTHRRVQRLRKREAALAEHEYEAEVRLKLSFEHMGMRWNVAGIADGIRLGRETVVIEEIKSTHRDLNEITPDESHWHMAQAKCYGHIYAENNGTNEITIDLTYSSVEQDMNRTFSVCFSAGELKAFFYDLVGRYQRWAELEYDKLAKRTETIKAASFPYDAYRKGQREFAVLTYRAIQNRNKLFIEAPTGTGKTISALFPAVKALGEGLADKIFYLTAKTITRQAAVNAANLMADKGCAFTYVAMTAKDKLCFLPERICTPETCLNANGHFDRVNDALWELLSRTEKITRSELEITAREFTVCPYELMLDASLFADIIICDYNYAFDPVVSLKRFFGDNVTGKYTFLIDEAHNLVDRAREMYSAVLYKKDFSGIRKYFKGRKNEIAKIISKINAEILRICGTVPEDLEAITSQSQPTELYALLTGFRELMDKWLSANSRSEGFAECMETYFKTLGFLRVSECFNDYYTVYLERDTSEITLLCLDPAENLANALSKAAGGIFFSATLTPLDYFRNILGGLETDKTARLPSPFNRENICVTVENRISAKYKDRTAQGFENTANALYSMISAKKGNYFAFFSSYTYLKNVYDTFILKYPLEKTIIQAQSMNEPEREAFLDSFRSITEPLPEPCEPNKSGILAFAVMGGIFSEGIDLTGDRLIGAAIIGVGLPLISPRRDALRDYYEKTLTGGFEYAYMYPGMNKVLQAAGRVQRTETDTGIILLIDSRFTDRRYQELFPFEWRLFQKPSYTKNLNDIFIDFWQKRGTSKD